MSALDFPATSRNRTYIAERLEALLPGDEARSGFRMLEIASGSGQHAVFFAQRWPEITVVPSDPNEDHRASVTAWTQDEGVANVEAPLDIDTTAPQWPVNPHSIDLVLCCNMIHIAPWSACVGLLAGAPAVLRPRAPLVLYGPFMRGGKHTAESNEAFSERLQQRDPEWGVRDLDEVAAVAAEHGFSSPEIHEMPANNLFVVFGR